MPPPRRLLVALIVDESKWLTASMGLALLAVAFLLLTHRRSPLPTRRLVLAAMNLFFGVTIGAMAFGHLLAVTTKLAGGDARGAARSVLRHRHGARDSVVVAHPAHAALARG